MSNNPNYYKEYYLKNKDKILNKIKINQKEKYNNDIDYKLIKRYQSRIDNIFHQRIYDAEDVLGCSIEFFRKYLEFCLHTKNLTSDDLDNIHLDHIKPINSFADKDIPKALNWTNIYPITKDDNLKKADNRIHQLEVDQKNRVLKFIQTIFLD